VVHELGRRVITRFVEDVIAESRRRIEALNPASAADIRAASRTTVCFSDAMAEADRAVKAFLYPHMYRHPRVMRVRTEAASIVRALFDAFAEDAGRMPEEWSHAARAVNGPDEDGRRLRIICDYIAGMTDRYAAQEHRRLFGWAPELR
jgi:dGTPase